MLFRLCLCFALLCLFQADAGVNVFNCSADEHVFVSSMLTRLGSSHADQTLRITVTLDAEVQMITGTITVDLCLFGICVAGWSAFDVCAIFGCPLVPGNDSEASFALRIPYDAATGAPLTIRLHVDGTSASNGSTSFVCHELEIIVPEGPPPSSEPLGPSVSPYARRLAALRTIFDGTTDSIHQRSMLMQIYESEPLLGGLFAAWRVQFGKEHPKYYRSAQDEARRYQAFKNNLVQMISSFRAAGLHLNADERMDMTRDELHTLAHFA